ncbi:guanylate kinase [Methylohalobius crimeensis]|uniref:guanylate kinase n=1 Tax=Methylohalobius crimeensis TaxID=244365 RepID=UPI0003B4D753|nr:guanylate kinase [Methylohalobius crimeensis]
MAKGTLFIVSAPSGAGKTSLLKQLREELENVVISVSYTTRSMRPGEVDGKDYCFVTREQFETMLAEDAFLEYARVFDNYYGTARAQVQENLARSLDVILEIDWQGARQVREKLPDSRSVFILPPARDILEERLRGRGQDRPDIIARRMRDARAEISHYAEYDYLVVNDHFEQALGQLKSILIADRLRLDRQQETLGELLQNLLA